MSLKESLRKRPFIVSAYTKMTQACQRVKCTVGNFFARRTHLYFSVYKNEIDSTAKIDPTAWVAPKGVRIGKRCVVGPHAVILEKTVLEDDVVIGAGSVVSSDGFVARKFGSKTVMVIHVGGVRIRSRTTVGAKCGIDKATNKTWTEIGEDSIIGELVHVAHNVKLGSRNQIASEVMIAGHVETGSDVQMGENASITDSIRIGNHAWIAPGAVVTQDVQDHARLAGNFAIDEQKYRAYALKIARGTEKQ